MSTTFYSERLGRISDEQLQAALERLGLGRLIAAEPARGGNWGQNVFVTSTSGAWVLRGAPRPPHQLDHERFFTERLHERTTAPVPWPYRVERSERIFGWSFAIMPRLPGLALSDDTLRCGLERPARAAIARALGRQLAELQKLTWPTAGEYAAGRGGIRPFGRARAMSHADWIAESLGAVLERTRRLTAADRDWAGAVLAESDAALRIPFTPRFVMRDYHEQNVLVEREADEWRISGVFDYDGYFGDGERDLVRCCAVQAAETDPGVARDFVRAYADRAPLRPGHRERFRAYMLLDRALIWGFAQRKGVWWDPTLPFRAWAEPCVGMDPF